MVKTGWRIFVVYDLWWFIIAFEIPSMSTQMFQNHTHACALSTCYSIWCWCIVIFYHGLISRSQNCNGFSAFQKWSIQGWVFQRFANDLSGDGSSGEANDVPYSMAMLGGGRKFPHDIAGFYPHQISMVFPWNPHQSLNPNHIHVLYIYMYTYII